MIAMNFIQRARTALMRKTLVGTAAVALTLGVTAVAWSGLGSAAVANTGQVIARVNGQNITRAAFERVWGETRDQSRALEMQENRQVVLDAIVGAELLAQQARRDKQLMSDAQLQAAMEMQARNLLANAYASEFMRRNPATDVQLKAAYDQFVKDLGGEELHLRHVLLAKQADAEALHQRLAKGEISFAKALEQTEERTADGKKGSGDLGWLATGRLQGPLREALSGATPGSVIKPYNDQFGWHVVQMEDKRALKAPAFEDVRGELIPLAQRTQLREHLVALKDKASIAF